MNCMEIKRKIKTNAKRHLAKHFGAETQLPFANDINMQSNNPKTFFALFFSNIHDMGELSLIF